MQETTYDRSLTLLRKHLTPEQLRRFDTTKGFTCTGSLSKHDYFIRYGKKVVDESGVEYCIVPRSIGDIPELDAMLAKKLLIETDERSFLSTAIPDRWTPEHYEFRRRQQRGSNFSIILSLVVLLIMVMYIIATFMVP